MALLNVRSVDEYLHVGDLSAKVHRLLCDRCNPIKEYDDGKF